MDSTIKESIEDVIAEFWKKNDDELRILSEQIENNPMLSFKKLLRRLIDYVNNATRVFTLASNKESRTCDGCLIPLCKGCPAINLVSSKKE